MSGNFVYKQILTESFEFVGSKDFKVGNDSAAKARNVMSTNQGGQKYNCFHTHTTLSSNSALF